MSNPPESWEDEQQQQQQQQQSGLPQQFGRMNLGGSGGGGGGPSFNLGAAEFVPSFGGQDTYQQQSDPYYQQQYYQQGGYQQQGYSQQQYQQGGYQQRQPQQRGYQQQQGYSGYSQQQQFQDYRQQQSSQQAYDPQQQAYRAPTNNAPRAAAPPAKAATISIGGSKPAAPAPAPAKAVSISIGGTKPAAEAPKAAAAPAPAKAVSISIGGASKPKEAPAAAKEAPVVEKKEEEPSKAEEKAEPKVEQTEKKVAEETPAETAAAETDEAEDDEEEDKVDEEDMDIGKEHINIVFIGHVDAGKSTMGGHLLYLTGMVDKRTMDKYEKEAKELGRESWYLSWALDLNAEERNKGKTTEYGRGYFETEKRRFTILDAPGHKSFVPSMIGGASQADVGVLVISARKGEFETGFERGGQTREHAMLAKTAGVKRLILVVNKMDDSTVNWSTERYDECVGKIMPFLKQVGFNPKTDLDIVPVSGFTGANLKDRVSKELCPWYDGPSLIELLDNMVIPDRGFNRPFMMPVSDKFKDMGCVVTGKIESGKIRKGQKLLLMPNKQKCEVSAIMQESDEITIARSGDNVRIRLRGVEEEEIMPGFVLCTNKNPVHYTTVFDAQLAIIEYKNIICAGYNAVMHLHTAVEEITLSALLHSVDKKTGKKTKRPPQFLKQGDVAIVRVETSQPVCIETYADYPQLGRFTLRDEGKTIAIGKVTKIIHEA
ncbi:P-loop containing nucleoside triphosphate hydrolase protein [Phlyctochytrium arcticum]|nr:P-loop containing nucleoside triphosphate hydrolase protein [Phlyctochytrium arcticum]